MFDAFLRQFGSSLLTRQRVQLAFVVAIATDLLQIGLGPFGWAFADELLDLATLLILAQLIGFHPLLLPTFVLEFVPAADMLPTWTGCVAAVVFIRRRQHTVIPPASGPIIDV